MKKLLFGLLLLLAIGVASPPSAPVNVSYTYSSSMEPTIPTNAAYVLVPANGVHTGEIITFWSPQRGEYVTHRVVEATDSGFVTQGDNNENTDQAAGYSYVQREEVIGEVLTLGGKPVIIPYLGQLAIVANEHVRLVQGLAGALLLLALGMGVWSSTSGQRSERPTRAVERLNDLAIPLFVLIPVLLVGLLVGIPMLTSQTQIFVVTSGNASAQGLLAPEETIVHTVELNRSSSPLTTTFVTVDGATVVEQSRNATVRRITERITAPREVGPLAVRLTTYAYPSLLPYHVLAALHRVHPVAAATACVLILLLPTVAAYVLTIDGRTPIRQTKRNWLRRLKRW